MSKEAFGSYDTNCAVDFIARHEGLSLQAYQCSAGVWTIGYGHTGTVIKNGEAVPISQGMRITEAQAKGILNNDLTEFHDALTLCVDVPVTKCQYVALLSLTYNIGIGAFKKSTLLKKLNMCMYAAAAEEFPKWNKIRGVVSKGLTKRRADERDLFLKDL